MSETNRKIIVDAITRMLARREHSIVEISTKLTQKGLESPDFMPIIAEFAEADIQSDARFAEAKVRSALSKGHGPRRLRAELNQHDIGSALLDQALAEVEPDWFALALNVRAKKYGLAPPQDFKHRQKQMQFLQYRGFYQEHIQYALEGSEA